MPTPKIRIPIRDESNGPPAPGAPVYQASRGGWYPPEPRPVPGTPKD